MVKLFRRIRRKILSEGRLRKYFIYAFGEIFLIVIGILIALQLNNSNEVRKIRIDEVNILKDLNKGLQIDLSMVDYNIERHSRAIYSGEIILDFLNKKTNYSDSLSIHFAGIHYYTNFMYGRGAYESLKSKGFEIISNKNLRYEIIQLYETSYAIIKDNDIQLTEDIFHIKRNFNQDHFDKFQLFEPNIPSGIIYAGEMIPTNANELQNNVQYKYFINSLIASHSLVNSLYKLLKVKIQNTIDQSSLEIQALSE